MHESVLFWGLLKAQAAFPQYGKLACVPTDKIAWRRHRAPIEEEPEINHKALLLLLYPVAARAANLHSGTPGPIDRCSAAHPAPPPPRPRAESKIFASERPEGVPGGGGGGARGSRARAEAQLRKHALTVGRLIPPNVTCAKRPPESLLWRRPLIFQTTFNPSVNSKKFEIKFSFVGFLQISNLGLVSCGVGRPWRDRGGAAVPSLIFCCQPLRLPPARGWGVGMSKVQRFQPSSSNLGLFWRWLDFLGVNSQNQVSKTLPISFSITYFDFTLVALDLATQLLKFLIFICQLCTNTKDIAGYSVLW